MFCAVVMPGIASASVFDGKVIGLDAGHGNGATGAVGYCGETAVEEYRVNLAVREELTALINATATDAVHHIAQLDTRKARVADAEDNGADVLVSLHHNGSSDSSVDYTRSFVTQKNDREFAKVLHPILADALGVGDRGIKNDGYGMTVYGSLPGILTESYFITNTDAACDFLDYEAGEAGTRVHTEAQALFEGLVEYFSAFDSGGGSDDGGGNGNGTCPPGKEKNGKC